MTNKQFHDAILHEGPIPVEMVPGGPHQPKAYPQPAVRMAVLRHTIS